MSGNGVGARVEADQYASDINTLQRMVEKIYAGFEVKPLVLGPGGFFDASWFREFIDKTLKSLQVLTHHIYNLGPGILAVHYPCQQLLSYFYHFSHIQGLTITSLKKFLIHPILMAAPSHSKTSKAFYRVLQLQQLLGLVKLEGLTTVAIILSLMHLFSVSGK